MDSLEVLCKSLKKFFMLWADMARMGGGGSYGPSRAEREKRRKREEKIESFANSLVGLIKSGEEGWEEFGSKKIKTRGKTVLCLFCGDYGHRGGREWPRSGDVDNYILCLGKARGNPKGERLDYSDSVLLNKKCGVPFYGFPKGNSIYLEKGFLKEVDEKLYDSVWDFCIERDRKEEKKYSGVHLWDNEEKMFLIVLSDYLKREFCEQKYMFLKGEQELPARLIKLEKKLDAIEFLKIKRTLEKTFLEQIREQGINGDRSFERFSEMASLARDCGLDTEQAIERLRHYKRWVGKDFEEKMLKLKEDRKEKVKNIESVLEGLKN